MSTFEEIKDEINSLDNFDRYEYVMDWSDKGNDLPEEFCTDKTFIKGCTSKLWCSIHENKYKTRADAIITQGLARMVCEIFNNITIEEASTFNPQQMTQ
jgi:sulfur transfer protein SufE